MGRTGAYLRLSMCDHFFVVFFLCGVCIIILMLCEPVSLCFVCMCATKSSEYVHNIIMNSWFKCFGFVS